MSVRPHSRDEAAVTMLPALRVRSLAELAAALAELNAHERAFRAVMAPARGGGGKGAPSKSAPSAPTK